MTNVTKQGVRNLNNVRGTKRRVLSPEEQRDALLKNLRELATLATPGPWRQGNVERHNIFVECCDGFGPERVLLRMNDYAPWRESYPRDASFIAAANPKAVLDVLDYVAELEIQVDAHNDASTPAFDEIAALCGCPQWEYPAQVIRDVQGVVKERDELRARLDCDGKGCGTDEDKACLRCCRIMLKNYDANHGERCDAEQERLRDNGERFAREAAALRELVKEACDIAATLSNYVEKFPATGGPTMTDRRIAAIRKEANCG